MLLDKVQVGELFIVPPVAVHVGLEETFKALGKIITTLPVLVNPV